MSERYPGIVGRRNRNFPIDINNLTAITTPEEADELVVNSSTAGANRKITRQNFLKPDFESSNQSVTADTILDVAHGLGAIPNIYLVVLVCTTADLGYAVGDELIVSSGGVDHSLGDAGVTIYADSTNVSIVQGVGFRLISQSTLNEGGLTTSSWRWVVRAWT